MSDPTTPEPGQGDATPPPSQWGEQASPEAGAGSSPTQPSYGNAPGYGSAPGYASAPGYGPPPGYGPGPSYPEPPAGFHYALPDDPGAQSAMVVGVLGVVIGFFCGVGFLASPFALVMGLKSKQRIDASGGKLGGRGNAQAGFILGIIGTVCLVLAILALITFIVVVAFLWNDSTIVINDTGVYA